MNSEAVAGLREVYDLLASCDQPSSIRRADELKDAADKVSSCAVDLIDVDEPHDLQHRLASAVRAIKAAEKAARAHRRNLLTRPLSHMRFALNVGSAHGALHVVLEKLDPANTPPFSKFQYGSRT
jgi:hypothetical protein